MAIHQDQSYSFPFTAIVGQEEFKTALILSVIDPSVGGVLAIGDRGAGKTTLIRSLSQLMTQDEQSLPFVNLPIGASEDRLLGHVNIEKLINEKKEEIQPGLLSKAHKGILYVDEINLLNDYLMDILLDAAASGSYYLEREGLSKKFDSRFVLIGSMNPEEGDLRPQLRDRFGFSVVVKTPNSKEDRVRVIENRIEFDQNPEAFTKKHQQELAKLRKTISSARDLLNKVTVSKSNLMDSVSIALEHRVEGMRADVLLVKAARAWAAFNGKLTIEKEDIETIAPLVLNHRSNDPNNEEKPTPPNPSQPQEQNQHSEPPPQHSFEPLYPESSLNTKQSGIASKKGNSDALEFGTFKKVDYKTARENIDIKKTVQQYVATDKLAIQKKYESSKAIPKLVFLIDSSGSMVRDKAIAYAKGLIHKTYEQQKKTQFAIVAIHHSSAQVLQYFTQDQKQLATALDSLPVGGKTNIIAGVEQLNQLIKPSEQNTTQLAIITDGRFNTGVENNVFEESVKLCKRSWQNYGALVVVDSEQGTVRLGLAKTFATAIGSDYQLLNVPHHV